MLAFVGMISFWFLFVEFRGITEPGGMEQASIAREVARGNGLVTKSVRPLDLFYQRQQLERDGEPVDLAHFPNSYHAPLNPLVESLALRASKGWWETADTNPDPTQKFAGTYEPDRILAGLAVVFFVISVGVNYLLLSRIFDQVIAGFTCLLLISCDLLWRFTLTGLPHMLLLLLFSLACLFLHRALENSLENRLTIPLVLAAGVCLGLMTLSHWLCLWLVAGAIAFAGLFIRPRPVSVGILLALVVPGLVWWCGVQFKHTGLPYGIAFLSPVSGVEGGQLQDDNIAMSAFSEQARQSSIKDLPARLALGTIDQITDFLKLFGGVIAAPLFFVALLQPFRREATSQFRWGVLLMWLPAAVGMSFYGLHANAAVSNQLHFLFIPIMSAYGLAMIAVLWNRLSIPADLPLRRTMPLALIALICALPLSLNIARNIRLLPFLTESKNIVPPVIGNVSVNAMRDLRKKVAEGDYVFSDAPWAVAWYADRPAVWVPTQIQDLSLITNKLQDDGRTCAGIVLTMNTMDQHLFSGMISGNTPASAVAHLGFEVVQQGMLAQRTRYEQAGIKFLKPTIVEGDRLTLLYNPTEPAR